MDIKNLASNRARLIGVFGSPLGEDDRLNGFDKIKLEFEGGDVVSLAINDETDELVYLKDEKKDAVVLDLASVIPSIEHAVGLNLFWAWEMVNHQGYFDALQLEFLSDDMQERELLQFKAASYIWLSKVEEIGSRVTH